MRRASRSRFARAWLFALAVGPAGFAPKVSAHDLWLVPPAGGARPGEAATLVASTGMDFPKSTSALEPGRVARARLFGPSGTAVTLSEFRKEGDALLVVARPEVAGTFVAAFETKPKVLELAAEDFNRYLLHDGLPDTHHWRKERGLLEKPAVERYSKFAKCLLRVGDSGESRATGTLGLAVEIVPLADPFALRPKDMLPIRLLFRGAPVEKALVAWDLSGGGEGFDGSARTDANGEAKVPLGRPGLFTVRAIHMTRPDLPECEWESFWASLTFEVRDPARR